MPARTMARLAWLTFGLVALAYLTSLGFSVLNRATHYPGVPAFDALVVAFFSFPAVGVMVASRHSGNAIGWILLSIGLAWGLHGLLKGYSLYGLVTRPGSLPRPDMALALGSWLWVPAVGLMAIFLILLFPDGRLASPRWRALAWLSAITLGVLSLTGLFRPGPFSDDGFPGVTNPLGAEALRPVLGVLDASAILLLLLCIAASAVSLVQRFRRSQGEERFQLKWLAAAAGAVAFAYAAFMAAGGVKYFFGVAIVPAWFAHISVGSFLLIPVAIGIAILRYRLYDIDIIINRALVYGALTVLLALAYFGIVVLLQRAFDPITGESDVAIAASTLAVAALFRPLRARVQTFIDHRFYRRKYDAEQTLADFSARLRDQLDLDALTAELVAVVTRTMQPSHVSLWLRPRPP